MIANEYTNEDGKLYQWITSGHDLTLSVNKVEVKLNQVHDAPIVNSKVQMFFVNERVKAAGEFPNRIKQTKKWRHLSSQQEHSVVVQEKGNKWNKLNNNKQQQQQML